jgi:N-acetylmuramic acid 6-phosphate etherase
MSNNTLLFKQLQTLSTESRNRKSTTIDAMTVPAMLRTINDQDQNVPLAVRKEISHISYAVELVVRALRSGGRLIYVGAGTSGRLGVLDAAECPPTFGTSPETVQGIIAGGWGALRRSREGAEDNAADGARQIKLKRVGPNDVVCGIAASIRTPFVVGAVSAAKKAGAKTVYITTNPRKRFNQPSFASLRKSVDVAICIDVGPEVIMGSTRMKSGTAQKLVLNMITTASMIRLGKVYENMMVDLKMNSGKLRERAKRVVMIATGVDYSTAAKTLTEARWSVKTAMVMLKTGSTRSHAEKLLQRGEGFVRRAISASK